MAITISPGQRDQTTEYFEGLGQTSQGGLARGGGFYVDNTGTWNFGYGYNMTGNNVSGGSGYWQTALLAAGVPQNVVSSAATEMASSGSATANAAAANSVLTSSLTAAQISTAEISSMEIGVRVDLERIPR